MFDRLPDISNAGQASTHLLIRACSDRSLACPEEPFQRGSQTLFEWLCGLPEQDRYDVDLPVSQNRGKDKRRSCRSAHRAQLVVRFGRTRIWLPQWADRSASGSIALWAIDVCEDASTVVGQENPVHWRLLTTDHARQCIDWYRQRWHIEQMFRTLKQQGLDVESSQLEEAGRLPKLVVLAASAAVHTLQLTLAQEGRNTRPASDCFNEQERALAQRRQPDAGRQDTKAEESAHADQPGVGRVDRGAPGRLEGLRQRAQARAHHHAGWPAGAGAHPPWLGPGSWVG